MDSQVKCNDYRQLLAGSWNSHDQFDRRKPVIRFHLAWKI